MALTFDLRSVADFQSIEPSLARDIIFQTMFVGINRITEDNYVEFYERLKAGEARFGITLFNASGDASIYTLDVIKSFIGLKTNASKLTKAQWLKNLSGGEDGFDDEADLVDSGTFMYQP